ncbi:hypothetical protein MiSe_54750 [Microseira wollei NIES-4236]|uniref:Transposase n=1 Tax=Microseira wollei NIES-4236 TaxID=2530354 RepID=A0AAV3XJG7_9CYAN|nr:hypothetical protein MiSe_54750 [Microseira wollei NIES-4236]
MAGRSGKYSHEQRAATNLRRDKMASLEGDLGIWEKGFGLFILPPSPFSQIPFLTVLSCAYLVAQRAAIRLDDCNRHRLSERSIKLTKL